MERTDSIESAMRSLLGRLQKRPLQRLDRTGGSLALTNIACLMGAGYIGRWFSDMLRTIISLRYTVA